MAFPTATPWSTYDWPPEAGEGVTLAESLHQENVAPHDHAFHELVLVRGGRGRHVTVEGETRLRAGSVLFVPVQIWHAYEACRDLDLAMWLIHPLLAEKRLALLQELAPWLMRSRAAWTVRVGDANARALASLWARMQSPGKVARFQFWSRLLEVLAPVDAAWRKAGQPGGLRFPPGTHVAVLRCQELIEARFAEPWSVASLAEAAGGLHPAHLMRLYKAATGRTIQEALAGRRLRRAANLLLATGQSVTEIALACGWAESNYFARCFRQHYGQSPREFRRARTARYASGGGALT